MVLVTTSYRLRHVNELNLGFFAQCSEECRDEFNPRVCDTTSNIEETVGI